MTVVKAYVRRGKVAALRSYWESTCSPPQPTRLDLLNRTWRRPEENVDCRTTMTSIPGLGVQDDDNVDGVKDHDHHHNHHHQGIYHGGDRGNDEYYKDRQQEKEHCDSDKILDLESDIDIDSIHHPQTFPIDITPFTPTLVNGEIPSFPHHLTVTVEEEEEEVEEVEEEEEEKDAPPSSHLTHIPQNSLVSHMSQELSVSRIHQEDCVSRTTEHASVSWTEHSLVSFSVSRTTGRSSARHVTQADPSENSSASHQFTTTKAIESDMDQNVDLSEEEGSEVENLSRRKFEKYKRKTLSPPLLSPGVYRIEKTRSPPSFLLHPCSFRTSPEPTSLPSSPETTPQLSFLPTLRQPTLAISSSRPPPEQTPLPSSSRRSEQTPWSKNSREARTSAKALAKRLEYERMMDAKRRR
ncbi:hypothetical protein M231_04065 [Tremella mesenterica]|uniref:Uncharacterized protein n=1 Tax=Tremella mesenterica TaxID=5217 RepID=A0A4Q1BLJ0_TREME|nr:hypothetical protein M231_04065 [Tremella mesenterica]